MNTKGNPAFGKTIVGRPRTKKQDSPQTTPLDSSVFQKIDDLIDANLLDLIEVLLERAKKAKDKQAAMYLLDRRLGKIPDRTSERDDQLTLTLKTIAESISRSSGSEADLGSSEEVV